MFVDVVTEIEIHQPCDEVAAFAADPVNAPAWYVNIKSAGWDGPANLAVGGRMRFSAQFLGRTLAYTYVIREYVPGSRFVMAAADGPFAMETTYEWVAAGDDATRMTLRNRGDPLVSRVSPRRRCSARCGVRTRRISGASSSSSRISRIGDLCGINLKRVEVTLGMPASGAA